MGKSNSCGFSVGINFMVLGFSIVALILHDMVLTEANNLPHEFIKDLNDNWKLNYITDIISTTSYTCPQDYEFLISNEWPGTNPGCLCYSSVVTLGSCRENQLDGNKQCRDISGIDSIQYQTWNNKRICVKRGSMNYFDINTKKPTCLSDKPKRCGFIDTLNNTLCVGLTESCPINEILITDINATVNNITKIYQSISLTDKKILFSTQDTAGIIPIAIKVSDETPCVNPKYQNFYRGLGYVLDYHFTKETCSVPVIGKREDSSYKMLDTYSFENVLRENGIFNIYNKLSSLPLFPKNKLTHSSGMYSKPYFGMKVTCKANFLSKISNITFYNDYLDKLATSSKTYPDTVSRTTALLVIQLIFVALWFLINLMYKCINFKETSSWQANLSVLFTVAATILSVLALGFFANAVMEFNYDMSNLMYLDNCVDDTTDYLVKMFITNYKAMQTNGIVVSILLGLNIGLIIIELLIWRCYDPEVEIEEDIVLVIDEDDSSKKGAITNKKGKTESVVGLKNQDKDIIQYQNENKSNSIDFGERLKLNNKEDSMNKEVNSSRDSKANKSDALTINNVILFLIITI